MKRLLICLLVMFSLSLLSAMSMDDAIDYVLDTGGFENHKGTVYFLSSTILNEDELPSEEEAQHYLAQTLFVFNLVRNGWGDFTSTSDTDNIKRCSKVACPYTNGSQEYLLELPVSEVKNLITESEFDQRGDDCFEDFMSYVRNYADVRNLGMWLEE